MRVTTQSTACMNPPGTWAPWVANDLAVLTTCTAYSTGAAIVAESAMEAGRPWDGERGGVLVRVSSTHTHTHTHKHTQLFRDLVPRPWVRPWLPVCRWAWSWLPWLQPSPWQTRLQRRRPRDVRPGSPPHSQWAPTLLLQHTQTSQTSADPRWVFR